MIFAFSLCVNEFIYAFTFISSSDAADDLGRRAERADPRRRLLLGRMMAAVLIPSIPLALLYNAFLDRFINGFTGGAFR